MEDHYSEAETGTLNLSPEPFYLDPDYEGFIPGKTPLKFKTVGKTNVFGCLTGLVTFLFGSAALLFWIPLFASQISDGGVDGSLLLLIGMGLILPIFGIWTMRRFVLQQQRYNRLRLEGEVREGILIDVRLILTDLDVEYAFSTPKGVRLRRKQRGHRPDLFDQPLPAYGTLVQVLYADDDALIML